MERMNSKNSNNDPLHSLRCNILLFHTDLLLALNPSDTPHPLSSSNVRAVKPTPKFTAFSSSTTSNRPEGNAPHIPGTSTGSTHLKHSSLDFESSLFHQLITTVHSFLASSFDIKHITSPEVFFNEPWADSTALVIIYGMYPLTHRGFLHKLEHYLFKKNGKVLGIGTGHALIRSPAQSVHPKGNDTVIFHSQSLPSSSSPSPSNTSGIHLQEILNGVATHQNNYSSSKSHDYSHGPSLEPLPISRSDHISSSSPLSSQNPSHPPLSPKSSAPPSLITPNLLAQQFQVYCTGTSLPLAHICATYASTQAAALVESECSASPSSSSSTSHSLHTNTTTTPPTPTTLTLTQGQVILSNFILTQEHTPVWKWLFQDRFQLFSNSSSKSKATQAESIPASTLADFNQTQHYPPIHVSGLYPDKIRSHFQTQLSALSSSNASSSSSSPYTLHDGTSQFQFHFYTTYPSPSTASASASTSSHHVTPLLQCMDPPSPTLSDLAPIWKLYLPPTHPDPTVLLGSSFFEVNRYLYALSAAYAEHPPSIPCGTTLLYTPWTSSTQSVLDKHPQLLGLLPNGTVFVAEQQTQGRGRTLNRWISPKGSLAFTLVLHLSPTLPLVFLQYLMALVVADVLDLRIKWPNDLVARLPGTSSAWAKLGGILVTSLSMSTLHVCIGVGLNLANAHPTLAYAALATPPAAGPLLATLLSRFAHALDDLVQHPVSFFPEFERRYRARWVHEDAVVELNGQPVRILGLTPQGLLRVETLSDHTELAVQSDGNSFDLLQGLIFSRT